MTLERKEAAEDPGRAASDPSLGARASVSRREWFKASVGGSVGLALGGLLDVPAVRVAAKELKLSQVSELTTSCNFCS